MASPHGTLALVRSPRIGAATVLPSVAVTRRNHGSGLTMPHRFAIGDNVQFHPAAGRTIDPASGTYVVTKRLPGPRGKFHYRIKHPAESHERIVWESELSVA